MDRSKSETADTAAPAAEAAAISEAVTGNAERAARAEAANGAMTDEDRFRFECLRNMRYHEDRERHFERLHRGVMFVSALAGTATVGGALAAWPIFAALAGVVVSVLTTFDLVWGLDIEARRHSILKMRTCEALADLDDGGTLAKLRAALMRSYADEPPTMHAVNALAFNAAVSAMGRPVGQKIRVSPWQWLARHWFAFVSLDPHRA